MIKEFGVNNAKNIKSTCLKAIKPINNISSDNISFLKNKLNLEVIELNKKFPYTY